MTSFKLVLDTYIDFNDDSQSDIILFSNVMDYFFTIFFTCESIIKSIALGFILEKNSYLRDSWSILDFFIVVASLVDLSVKTVNLGVVRILRLLRTLRPLRFISHNKNMKLIVTALMESVDGIVNVLIVIILIWIMFGIFGITLL